MAEGESTSALEKAAGIVPTLYYDIIARIIPGSLFLLAVCWQGDTKASPEWIRQPSFGAGMLFLFCAYLTGMLLTTLGWVFDFVWWLLSAYWRDMGGLISKIGGVRTLWSAGDIAHAIDEVSRSNPAAATALYKMYAEVTLLENLLAGIVLCCGISRWGETVHVTQDPGYLSLVAALACAGLALRVLALNSRTQKICASELSAVSSYEASYKRLGERAEHVTGTEKPGCDRIIAEFKDRLDAYKCAAQDRDKLQMVIHGAEFITILKMDETTIAFGQDEIQDIKNKLSASLPERFQMPAPKDDSDPQTPRSPTGDTKHHDPLRATTFEPSVARPQAPPALSNSTSSMMATSQRTWWLLGSFVIVIAALGVYLRQQMSTQPAARTASGAGEARGK